MIRAFDPHSKANLVFDLWMCFLFYPFSIGFTFPFSPFVNEFFKATKICYSQVMPMLWRILYVLDKLN
ncbi:hypothetical protein Hanom_Chr15g01376371 [Helianthus anomalus]